MQISKLDLYLFRIVFAGIVLGICAMLAVWAFSALTTNRFERHEQLRTRTMTTAEKKEIKLRFGAPTNMEKASFVIIPLEAEGGDRSADSGKLYGYYKNTEYRNFYLIDKKTDQGSWLFSDNNTVVLNYRFNCIKDYDCKDLQVPGMFFEIKQGEDKVELRYMSFTEKKLKSLISGMDFLQSFSFINSDKAYITYPKDKKFFNSAINLKTGEVTSTSEIKI